MKGKFFLIAFLTWFLSFGQDDFLLASKQQAGGGSDPYITEGAVAYFNAENLALADGAAVTTFADASGNGYDLSQHGGAPEFDNDPGFNQIIHDGVDDGLIMAANHALLDFDPDDDDYTIILHWGDAIPTLFLRVVFMKGTNSARQFWWRSNSSGTNMAFRTGESGNESLSGIRDDLANGYFVVRKSGTDIEFYLNNALWTTEDNPGATMDTTPWAIGCRSDSPGNEAQNVRWRKWVFYDKAVSLAWLTDRYNNRDTE
jgi:hypothetical protein